LTQSLFAKAEARTKLLQTEQWYGMLLAVGSEAAHGGVEQNYMFVVGDTVNGLQQLQDTRGQAVFEALAKADGVSAHAASFQTKWRVAATDGAGSNEVAEAHIHRARR
jgi:hypothetical protein